MIMPNTTVTTYGLPSDLQNGGMVSDEMARTRRVQQQVAMRLAEKSTLPRQNGGSTSNYASSDYGSSSTMKYHTFTPNYSSKSSYMYSGSATMGAPRVAQRSGFSAQSAGPDLSQYNRMSVGAAGGGGGGGYYEETHYQMGTRQPQPLSMQAVQQHTATANPWLMDGSDAVSMVSDRDATFNNRQYAQSAVNGYNSLRQVGPMTTSAPMLRSLSGTLSGVRSGGGGMVGMEVNQQHAYKGPAYRTISRINQRNRMSMGSTSGTMQQISSGGSIYGGGDTVDRGFVVSGLNSGSQTMMQRPISRAASMRSIHSVGRGMMGSMGNLSGIATLDMPTAVQNLRESDPELQVLGAAYIQHECYSDGDAKNEVRRLKGIGELVKLFNSENQEVQRFATGATRNLIYENMDNKVNLIEEGGIPQLVEALKEPDDELRKNITGIMWNLSSKDNLKEKLARETLSELTERILIPLSNGGESETIEQTPSEAEIFYNTTGCLRNLSSVNEKTRRLMRETPGLVDSLVGYVKALLNDNKSENKGVENAMCVLRNLSYQIYSEMPPSNANRLEGATRDQAGNDSTAIGCFTPQGRKAKNIKSQNISTFTEVSRVPKGMEWLWHPHIVGLYKRVLGECEMNSSTREAAAGALQNITAGDGRWPSVLSRHALEQERIQPVLLDLLRTNKDKELRSLTGLFRNLSRHATNKDDMATKVVNDLVTKLPESLNQKEPSTETVINICGVLNNLVTCSQVAARDITFFDGLQKLVGIKTSHDNSTAKMKAAKSASTVLSNMFHYKKLHKAYKEKGFGRTDFADMI